MNKMNLPPPFDGIDEKYPDAKEAYRNIEEFKEFLGITTETVQSIFKILIEIIFVQIKLKILKF